MSRIKLYPVSRYNLCPIQFVPDTICARYSLCPIQFVSDTNCADTNCADTICADTICSRYNLCRYNLYMNHFCYITRKRVFFIFMPKNLVWTQPQLDLNVTITSQVVVYAPAEKVENSFCFSSTSTLVEAMATDQLDTSSMVRSSTS